MDNNYQEKIKEINFNTAQDEGEQSLGTETKKKINFIKQNSDELSNHEPLSYLNSRKNSDKPHSMSIDMQQSDNNSKDQDLKSLEEGKKNLILLEQQLNEKINNNVNHTPKNLKSTRLEKKDSKLSEIIKIQSQNQIDVQMNESQFQQACGQLDEQEDVRLSKRFKFFIGIMCAIGFSLIIGGLIDCCVLKQKSEGLIFSAFGIIILLPALYILTKIMILKLKNIYPTPENLGLQAQPWMFTYRIQEKGSSNSGNIDENI